MNLLTKSVLSVVAMLLFFVLASWLTNLPLRLFPGSGVAAWFSGYSNTLYGYNDYGDIGMFKLDDGSEIIVRGYSENYGAIGLKAFPDGGSPYVVLKKMDLLHVDRNGKILWQNVYIENKASNYNDDKSRISNAVTYNLNDVPGITVLEKMGGLVPNLQTKVYKCTDTKYQFTSTISTIDTATAIDINTQEISTVPKSNAQCGKDITDLTLNPDRCEGMNKLFERNPNPDDFALYRAYNSYCLNDTLDTISL